MFQGRFQGSFQHGEGKPGTELRSGCETVKTTQMVFCEMRRKGKTGDECATRADVGAYRVPMGSRYVLLQEVYSGVCLANDPRFCAEARRCLSHLSPFENLKEASKHPRCFVFVRTRTVQELSRAKMQDA